MKKSFIFQAVLLTSLSLIISSCSRHSGSVAISQTGDLAFLCYLSPINSLAKTRSVTDPVELSKVVITLDGPSAFLADTTNCSGSSVAIDTTFSELEPGEWTVTVKTVSSAGEIVHDSTNIVQVLPGKKSQVNWNLNSKKSELNLSINKDSIPDSTGLIKLLVDGVLVDSIDWSKGETSFRAYLDVGKKYLVQVVFYSTDGVEMGTASGEVVPDGQESTKTVWKTVWKNGSLRIEIYLKAPNETTFEVVIN